MGWRAFLCQKRLATMCPVRLSLSHWTSPSPFSSISLVVHHISRSTPFSLFVKHFGYFGRVVLWGVRTVPGTSVDTPFGFNPLRLYSAQHLSMLQEGIGPPPPPQWRNKFGNRMSTGYHAVRIVRRVRVSGVDLISRRGCRSKRMNTVAVVPLMYSRNHMVI